MCEVNYTIQKKKNENSKYTYKMNEQGSQIFVFELLIFISNQHNFTLNHSVPTLHSKNNQITYTI
jgi:hypothetical protein